MSAIKTKRLVTLEDFQSIKKGDWLACTFHRDISDYPKKYRFNVFKVYEIIDHLKEIVLQRKNNIYFSYAMFLEGKSNLKEAVLISVNEDRYG